ncbi:YkgJ family cysteine cluster protein [Thiorhodococcus mannitoliphagus]|uniref:YkgJ family cysteine cluster protein n=1 Tax=Thiorhodococcus mannitoliphagus TaxID=329406 RepID=UPI0030B8A73F
MSPEAKARACRAGCAACCIAPSISSPIPGMPDGKPAGVPCIQLNADLSCKLFGARSRPSVCGSLAPSEEMCGSARSHALSMLATLEQLTSPETRCQPHE